MYVALAVIEMKKWESSFHSQVIISTKGYPEILVNSDL